MIEIILHGTAAEPQGSGRREMKMTYKQRVSIEQIVAAYRDTGSVWKSAKSLGLCGQSVWERLKAIDYPMGARRWTKEEYDELSELASNRTISQIAEVLGRPYYAVAIKISRLGLAKRYGNTLKRRVSRGSGFNKENVSKLIADLRRYEGSLRRFSRSKGLDLEGLVTAIQKYDIEFWKEYSKNRTDLSEAVCGYCEIVYHPMTAKQKYCTRSCAAAAKRDEDYFGGKRRQTIGLAEGVCQLCLQVKPKRLSSHHLLGKQNDPDNNFLIALCPGCHQLVGLLAGRKFVDDVQGWENLITLVMGRRLAERNDGSVGVHACVEIDHLTKEQVEEMQEVGIMEEVA